MGSRNHKYMWKRSKIQILFKFLKQNWHKIHWKFLKKSEFSPLKLRKYWYGQIPPNWGTRWSYSYLEATFCFTEKFHMGVTKPIFQPGSLWAFIFYEKWSYTVGTGVQMDRDVEFLKTVFAKSVFSIYPGLQITSLDLDSSFRWGLFSKPPSHAM